MNKEWEPSEASDAPVSVMRINNTTLIPIIKSLLNASQIRFLIKNERAHDLVGYFRLTSGGYNSFWQPEVLVEASRAEEAREMLEVPLREASETGTDGQTSLRSFTQPSGLTVVGLWLVLAPSILFAGVWAFKITWSYALLAFPMMIIFAEVLWKVTTNYLKTKAAARDETNA
jgi:hypothetical protein